MTGHLKSSCNLAGKIVRQRDVYITLLAPMSLYEKAQKEVAFQFKPGVEDHLHKLVRYLSDLYLFSRILIFLLERVIGVESSPVPTELALLRQSLISNYEKLVSGEPVEQVPGSGEFVDDFGSPQLVILDVSYLVFLYHEEQGFANSR